MMKLENIKRQIKISFVAVFVASGMMMGNRVMADCSAETVKNVEQARVETVPQQTKILIYTYENESYMVEGLLDLVQDGENGSGTLMEIRGNIKKMEDMQVRESDMNLTEAAPTVLTVHMGDKIFGFYSRHALMGGTGSDKEPMIYYGYLEGYFDDKQHYST